MKKNDIDIGGLYTAKVSGKLTVVRIDEPCGYHSTGWFATNLATGRQVRLKTAGRLRKAVDPQNASHRRYCKLALGIDIG